MCLVGGGKKTEKMENIRTLMTKNEIWVASRECRQFSEKGFYSKVLSSYDNLLATRCTHLPIFCDKKIFSVFWPEKFSAAIMMRELKLPFFFTPS